MLQYNQHKKASWLLGFSAQDNSGVVMATVATLALGSRPRQRGCKGAGQEEARESHQRLPGM